MAFSDIEAARLDVRFRTLYDIYAWPNRRTCGVNEIALDIHVTVGSG